MPEITPLSAVTINGLRGGMNDSGMPNGLADDECALAMNVERFYSAIGERRLGCETYSIIGSMLNTEALIVHLTERFPDNDITTPEYWAVGATVNQPFARVAKRDPVSWVTVIPVDRILTNAPNIYNIQTVNLNGKTFWAYESEVDRLHVFDPISLQLRPTGIAQPAAPTVADEGVGTYTGTRWFRVRFIAKDGADILRRSEPSDDVEFVPNGGSAGAIIGRPALVGDGETDWEVEASTDGAIFWRIQTLSIFTTTYNDETNLTTLTYPDQGPVSEPIGDYLLQASARFITTDGDRILLGGHWTDPELQSRVSWCPVLNDPGVGNDERQPLASGGDNYADLDNYNGGGLTGLGQVTNGTVYAFKWSQIHRATRTGELIHAYEWRCLTKERGALPGSIVGGVDEAGRACLYFLDPSVGPCSLGAAGLRVHMGMRKTWDRVNFSQEGIICRVCYYREKQQVIWWVAVDGEDMPGLVLKLQTTEVHSVGDGSAQGGWSLADGTIATATAVGIWHEIIVDAAGTTKLATRPFIGIPTAGDPLVQRCDIQDTDNGDAYHAVIQTKPYFLSGLLNTWGSMTTAILATASGTARVVVSCIRDFGLEQRDRPTDMAPQASEEFVVKRLDDLVMSEAAAIQFQFADPV